MRVYEANASGEEALYLALKRDMVCEESIEILKLVHKQNYL